MTAAEVMLLVHRVFEDACRAAGTLPARLAAGLHLLVIRRFPLPDLAHFEMVLWWILMVHVWEVM